VVGLIMPDFSTLADAGGALAIGYLLGSIPFGVLITRLAGVGDVRNVGSGNIGATNVLRTGRRDLAAITLVADGLKGALAVVIGISIGGWGPLAAATGAFLGHLFPLWIGFKGGKGVATYFGAVTAASPWAGILFAMSWLGAASVSRYSSLGALVASLVALVALYSLDDSAGLAVFGALTVILWIRHAGNIRRLFSGTEPKIGER
jgi:glycerol-3-phosphate acyltransferase PlsY